MIRGRKKRGFTVVEAVVYIAIFAIMMTFVVTLNISGSQLFRAGSASVDIQEDLNRALRRIQADLQETDSRGIAIGYVNAAGSAAYYPAPGNSYYAAPQSGGSPQITTAIIMLSPRKLNGDNAFDPYLVSSTSCLSNPGAPCWQNWVCYYLTPNPAASSASTTYTLVRAEFPISSSLKAGPSSTATITPGMPSSGWETYVRGHTAAQRVTLSSAIDRFAITNPVTNSGSPNCTSPPCSYTDPFNFDAPSGGNSVIEFSGLSWYWVNMESMEFQNTTMPNKARNFLQAVVRN